LERLENEIKIAQEIGRRVVHSTKNIFLSYAYGKPLQYHGELAGRAWLHSADFRVYKMMGRKNVKVEDRFNAISLRYSPEYFIVTDFRDYKRQAGLREFLTRNFPVLVQDDDYLIFDLRKGISSDRQLGNQAPLEMRKRG
jgi:hypothetical protein